MAWLEIHQGVWNNRKTLHLAGILGIDSDLAAAKMIRLWHWAIDNAETGELGNLPPYVIAHAANWQGDPDTFISAAVEAGYLDRDGGSLKLHDWWEYAGRLVEKRRRDAERKRQERRPSSTSPQSVQRTSSGHPTDIQRMSRRNTTVQNSTDTEPTTTTAPASSEVVAKVAAEVESDPTLLNDKSHFLRLAGTVVGLTPQGYQQIASALNRLVGVTYEDVPRLLLWEQVIDWEATCGADKTDAGKRYNSLLSYLKNRADRMREAAIAQKRAEHGPIAYPLPEEIERRKKRWLHEVPREVGTA